MKKPKVLILKNSISTYNTPTYNILARMFDLTVGYYLDNKSIIEEEYTPLRLDYRKVGPFVIIKGLRSLIKQYDVVTFVPDPHVLSYMLLPYMRRRCKVVSWGIGFRCSYTHPYIVDRQHTLVDNLIYRTCFRKADANIFYMKKALEFWSDKDIDKHKVFIAPNTTDVLNVDVAAGMKRTILFVGTLYKQKGVDLLLHAYKQAMSRFRSSIRLVIVGAGEMREELETYVKDNGLADMVVFPGAVYEEKVLAQYFQEALVCVSPTQGGLSCPKSMGYGVPFICKKDAITGGEIYHITPNVNGVMYDTDSDLVDILVDVFQHPGRYVDMGLKARDYYYHHATCAHMAEGAAKAIRFVLGDKS